MEAAIMSVLVRLEKVTTTETEWSSMLILVPHTCILHIKVGTERTSSNL